MEKGTERFGQRGEKNDFKRKKCGKRAASWAQRHSTASFHGLFSFSPFPSRSLGLSFLTTTTTTTTTATRPPPERKIRSPSPFLRNFSTLCLTRLVPSPVSPPPFLLPSFRHLRHRSSSLYAYRFSTIRPSPPFFPYLLILVIQ